MTEGELKKTCKNCNAVAVDQFCSQCGQREAHRITPLHVSHDIMHIFLHADKGIFPFIARLILTPGILAKEYIDGKRKIFNPYQYFFLSIGVVIFLMVKSGFYENMESMNQANVKGLPQGVQNAMADLNHFLKSHTNLLTYAFLPLFAFFSWAYFRNKGNNYAEHFTLIVFSISQVNTINALFLAASILVKGTAFQSALISFVLAIGSLVMTYHQFYKVKIANALGKSLLIFLSSYIIQITITLIVFFTYYFLFHAGK
ncbi:DUF3667 domain-containing protein [Pedobacter sp. PWIIR3]